MQVDFEAMNARVFPRLATAQTAVAPYARIKQWLKDELARGRWPPGAAMPSDAELVAQFGVSRMTVTRALNELSPLLFRRQGDLQGQEREARRSPLGHGAPSQLSADA